VSKFRYTASGLIAAGNKTGQIHHPGNPARHWTFIARRRQSTIAMPDFLRPGDYIVRARLAGLLEGQGDDAAALAQYRKTLKTKPDLARAHMKIADLLLRQDRYTGVLQHGQEALRIDPGLSGAHRVVAMVMEQQGRAGEAARHFSVARRLDSAKAGTRGDSRQMQAGHDWPGDAVASRDGGS
jgi:Flp pilus assembly protein TadD